MRGKKNDDSNSNENSRKRRDRGSQSLFEQPGISGSWEAVGEGEKEGTLVTVATIVGIVGGAIAIAEQICPW